MFTTTHHTNIIHTESMPLQLDDHAAHLRAARHAAAELGLTADPVVLWDDEHCLQGHLTVEGRHLVLIAPRRSDLRPLLLDEGEWDSLRHGIPIAA